MGYKVLITFDLNNITSTQRTEFYEKFKELKWSKVGKLTTTWKCSFVDNALRQAVTKTIISHLEKAKQHAKITTNVEYAFQMDKIDIEIGNL